MSEIMDWYKKVLSQYAVFTGRARRREFWMFTLVNGIIQTILSIIMNIFASMGVAAGVYFVYALLALYGLAVLVPSLAVAVRRMHDLGKGGGWIFITLIPIVGAIIFVIFCVKEGEAQDNRFGANPKANLQ